jgi:hypothetical protein
MKQVMEDQSLLQKLLHGKSEAEQRKVWEIVAKTGIAEDDPMFIAMVAMGSIEAAVVEIPKALSLQEERLAGTVDTLTEKIGELREFTLGLAATSKNLDKKLKTRLPRASRNSGLLARELLGVALLGGLYHRFGHRGASSLGEELAKTWVTPDYKGIGS